ncbi:FliI/YscN family ATPase [Enterobacteriaceae bacterium H20N1]|uniref:FliI/YscN family ATPase n=1 Tax=Dryocola boscaweniae TaxID=2925397 RepID=A0A9X2W4F7_9ENTR|nr:FliI/YscN family ATPase [Dryocola boscaweniae]MCT4700525.1 FliI/YscN family ATPase [Dryocola boscaweniae]MCT4717681.1 FliI/YscN family ATPase [Dryocola boscaweniae]
MTHHFPDPSQLACPLRLPEWPQSTSQRRFGKLVEVGEMLLKAVMPWARLGEICYVQPQNIPAEVVSIQGRHVLLSPFSSPQGLSCNQWVYSSGEEYTIALDDSLAGMMVDGLGRPLYGELKQVTERRSLYSPPPDPMSRALIEQPMPLGVRALDGVLTCGIGQRVGIFAAAGGGKSTLLSMVCDGAQADVVVLALVGERGREVREFTELVLSPEARAKSVIVVATSERPALERLKACWTATTIAEYFRDKGLNVLLMVDSLTRYARAVREVGLAAGEPPVSGGFPPTLFSQLPRLLERAGPAPKGSITGIYTVLVEGDNLNEPVADEVRSLIDGHIVLSRKLAESNHYPAIDVGASVSRVMHMVTTPPHRALAGKLRRMMSLYREIELLVRVGEYQPGQDHEADEALRRWPLIRAFLCQETDERSDYKQTLARLQQVVEG